MCCRSPLKSIWIDSPGKMAKEAANGFAAVAAAAVPAWLVVQGIDEFLQDVTSEESFVEMGACFFKACDAVGPLTTDDEADRGGVVNKEREL